MSGDRGVTRSVRVLGLMFSLLCLLSLARDTLEAFEDERNNPLEAIVKMRQAIEKAEAQQETSQSVIKLMEEIGAEIKRHTETVLDIIARGPPHDLLDKTKLSYQNLDATDKIEQAILYLKKSNEELERSLAAGKRALEMGPKAEL